MNLEGGLLGQIQIVAPEIVMDAGEALFQIEPFLHGEEGLAALAGDIVGPLVARIQVSLIHI